jgi:hypothetical protein
LFGGLTYTLTLVRPTTAERAICFRPDALLCISRLPIHQLFL